MAKIELTEVSSEILDKLIKYYEEGEEYKGYKEIFSLYLEEGNYDTFGIIKGAGQDGEDLLVRVILTDHQPIFREGEFIRDKFTVINVYDEGSGYYIDQDE